MSNYKNLINRILDDAESKKNDIVCKAKEEADKLIDSKIEEAKKIKEKLLDKARRDGEQTKEKIISKCELNIRKSKLDTKKKVLDTVFQEALDRLTKLDIDILKKYIINTLDNLELKGNYDLVIPSLYSKEEFNDFNYINNDLKITEIKPSNTLKGGFILEKNGTSVNYSFEILINFIREEIEFEVSNLLFN